MTLTPDYTATTRRAESAFIDGLDSWKNGLTAITAPLQSLPSPGTLPQFDASGVVALHLKFVKRVVDVNLGYAQQLAEATNTVTGAVRQHLEDLNTAVIEQLQSVSQATVSAADDIEDSVREAAERAQREARDEARAHFRGLNKTELTDEAAKRDLPKTGTVAELVERLVEHDTK